MFTQQRKVWFTAVRWSLALLTLPAFATAQMGSGPLSPIPQFVGDVSEGFETQAPGVFSGCLAEGAFAGKATICTPGTSGAGVAPSFTFMCTTTPLSGSQCYGSVDGATVIQFSEPVHSFGGWFAVSGGSSSLQFTFSDWEEQPNEFHEYANVTSDCQWVWFGWRCDGFAFSSVRIAGNSWNDGAFVEMDDLQISTTTPWRTYCDGSGISSACPCANAGAAGSGCANSSSILGSQLLASGTPSIAQPSLVLAAGDLPPNELVVFAEAETSGYGLAPLVLGDGVLCLRGALRRLHVGSSSINGSALATQAHTSPALLPGENRHYQVWYRDSGASPCSGGTNMTNAVSIRWIP